MSTASKVMIGLVLLLALPSIALVSMALKARSQWNEELESGRAAIENLEQQIRTARDGAQPGTGLNELRNALHKTLKQRGRVWRDGAPAAPNAETGEVTVNIAAPDPHGLQPPTIIYLFEQKTAFVENDAERGRYLGQFRVTQAGPGQVALQPALQLSSAERARLLASAESGGPWVLYEVMPADRYDVFAEMDPDTVRLGMPEGSVDDFLQHGQDATGLEVPAERVVDGKYVRRLRDYGLLFRELNRQRVEIEDEIASIENTVEGVRRAVTDAESQIEFRRTEIAALEARKQDMLGQAAAVEAYREKVAAELQAALERRDALLAQIEQAALAGGESP